MSYQNIIVETKGRVGIVRLNRPQQLNALNAALKAEVDQAVRALDADDNIGCIILTGSEKAFAAGADIKEMLDLTEPVENWEGIARARKPMIAAVAGVALGGGCEIAMQCDVIIAGDNARFGQPEIKIGVIPGFGGTQRLTHAIGKSKSMEMTLTGRMMDAQEAERSGLVARVVPVAQLMDEAMKMAELIASMSLPSVIAAKAAVNATFENSLAAGVKFERENFRRLFKTHDRVEGMKAFVEKRPPKWKYE